MIKLVKQSSWYTDSWAHRFLNGAEDAARYTLFRAGLGGEESYKKHVQQIAANQARRQSNRLLAERNKLLDRWERDGWIKPEEREKALSRTTGVTGVPSDAVTSAVNARLYGDKNTRGDIGEHRATKQQGYASTGWAGRYLGAAQPKYDDLFTSEEKQENPQLQSGAKNNSRLFGVGGSKALQHTLDTGSYFVPYVGQTMFGRDVAQHTIDANLSGLAGDVVGFGVAKGLSRVARPAVDRFSRYASKHSPEVVKTVARKLGLRASKPVVPVATRSKAWHQQHPTPQGVNVPSVTVPEANLPIFQNGKSVRSQVRNLFASNDGANTFWSKAVSGEMPAEAWRNDIDILAKHLAEVKKIRASAVSSGAGKSKLKRFDDYINDLTSTIARRKAIVRRMPVLPENPHAGWRTNLIKRPMANALRQGGAVMAGAAGIDNLQNAYDDIRNKRIGSAMYNAGLAALDAVGVAGPVSRIPRVTGTAASGVVGRVRRIPGIVGNAASRFIEPVNRYLDWVDRANMASKPFFNRLGTQAVSLPATHPLATQVAADIAISNALGFNQEGLPTTTTTSDAQVSPQDQQVADSDVLQAGQQNQQVAEANRAAASGAAAPNTTHGGSSFNWRNLVPVLVGVLGIGGAIMFLRWLFGGGGKRG